MKEPKFHKGVWFDWYSICSIHRKFDRSCNNCNTGSWSNRRKLWWSGLFFKLCPWGWRIWANRKTSPHRRRLERWFPNLRG